MTWKEVITGVKPISTFNTNDIDDNEFTIKQIFIRLEKLEGK